MSENPEDGSPAALPVDKLRAVIEESRVVAGLRRNLATLSWLSGDPAPAAEARDRIASQPAPDVSSEPEN